MDLATEIGLRKIRAMTVGIKLKKMASGAGAGSKFKDSH